MREKNVRVLPSVLIFFKSQIGSKDIYNTFNDKKSNPKQKCEQKWSLILNANFNWKNIHVLPSYITKNSKLQWFQYRIIHRILGTNELLLKIKIKDTNICSFGCGGVETIEHIFWTCPYISKLWEDLDSWIF